MAKGRKTKRAGRGKTKTPKAQRSKYSRKKRKISRKRSLKGGMLRRTGPDGRIVDEFHVNPGPGTTYLNTGFDPISNKPAIVIDPGPIIPTPPPPTRMLTAADLAALKTRYDKSGRSAAQRRAAEAKAIQEQRLREAAEAEEVNKTVNNLIEAIDWASRSSWAAEKLYDWDHSSIPPWLA